MARQLMEQDGSWATRLDTLWEETREARMVQTKVAIDNCIVGGEVRCFSVVRGSSRRRSLGSLSTNVLAGCCVSDTFCPIFLQHGLLSVWGVRYMQERKTLCVEDDCDKRVVNFPTTSSLVESSK